jgi:hypothetical protein
VKRFARLAVAFALAVVLTGCAGTRVGELFNTVSGATVPGYTVVAAAQAFDASEIAAAAYLGLPRCTATSGPACRIPSATPIIKGAFQSGRIARNELKVQLRAACTAEFNAGQPCSAGIPVASYNTLVAATKTIDDATAAWRAATGK